MFNEGEKEVGMKEKRKKMKEKMGQQREDRVKVVLVYFLEGVLLRRPHASKHEKVDKLTSERVPFASLPPSSHSGSR